MPVGEIGQREGQGGQEFLMSEHFRRGSANARPKKVPIGCYTRERSVGVPNVARRVVVSRLKTPARWKPGTLGWETPSRERPVQSLSRGARTSESIEF
jgi:hypothetical protein